MTYTQGEVQTFVLDCLHKPLKANELSDQAEKFSVTSQQLRKAVRQLLEAEWAGYRYPYYFVTRRGLQSRWMLPLFPFVQVGQAFIRDGALHVKYRDGDGDAIAILSPDCPAIVQREVGHE